MSFTDGEIYVSYQHMANGADDMVYQTQAIHQTLVDLKAEIEPLMQSWNGLDKAAYVTKHQEWETAVGDMNTLLLKNSQLLTELSDNYSYTEKQLQQMWDDVKVIG